MSDEAPPRDDDHPKPAEAEAKAEAAAPADPRSVPPMPVPAPAPPRPPSDRDTIGISVPTTIAAALCAVLDLAGIGLLFAFAGSLGRPEMRIIGGAGAAVAVIALGLASTGLYSMRRLVPGTRGRSRLTFHFGATAIYHLSLLTLGFVCFDIATRMFESERLLTTSLDEGLRYLFSDVRQSTSGVLAAAWLVAVVAGSFAELTLRITTLSSWFLIPKRIRLGLWSAFDLVILVAFVAVTILLPIQPASDDPAALALASVRLSVTVVFAVRVFVRTIGPFLNGIERVGFQALVAARHLRARKSDFLTAISVLSICAVSASSCSLVTTLSVMGGFRDDLKRKILGNHAHVVIDKEEGGFEQWQLALDQVRRVEGVSGAAPYVAGEVMLTSASNLGGAVLRGIDPAAIDAVIELRRNLRQGRIEYLEHPERLLDLPPEETRGFSLPLHTSWRARREDPDEAPPPPEDPNGISRDEVLDPPDLPELPPSRSGTRADPDEEVDRLLRGDTEPTRPVRQVLPGIIIGQELARSLRLYVGDEVNVVTPHGDLGPSGPMPKSRPFRVAGIFYSGMYEYDMKYCYVMLDTAQRFLGQGTSITGIEIKVDEIERAPAIADEIRSAVARPDLRVQDWQELNKNLFGALALEKLAMFVALGIAILVAGFCVFGTLTLMVQEKGREVGILKAMGTASQAIIAIFMFEGLLIGLFGATIGLGLGYVACFIMEHFGIRMSPEVYYIDRLPVHVDGIEFALVALASTLVSLVATIFPALLASKMRPVDALRYE